MTIRILLIDDSGLDRLLEKRGITAAYPIAQVDAIDRPPKNLEAIPEIYDGVIIDENLAAGVSGTMVAKELHEKYWRTLPVMLMTGMQRGSHFYGAYDYCDWVCYKNDEPEFIGCVKALIRAVSRIKGDAP